MDNRWYDPVMENLRAQKALIARRSAQGIEQARKGDARLYFVNEAGDPVDHVRVEVNQTRHDFQFGCTAFPLGGFGHEEKNARFEEEFARLFNLVVCPFFWDTLEPVKGQPRYAADSPKIPRRPAPDLVCDFAERHGLTVKGHALVYCGHAPDWIEDDIPQYKALLEEHIAELSARYAKRVQDWDAVNEALQGWFDKRNPAMRAKPLSFHHSDGYVEWCLRTARRYFPDNNLFVNEGAPIVLGGDRFAYEREPFFLLLKLLRLQGCAPDAAGLMLHLFMEKEEMKRGLFDAENMYEALDYALEFGVPLNLSELTIPAYSDSEEDEAFQAELTETLYRIWFGHPVFRSIVWWNMADGTAYVDKVMHHDENRYCQGLIRRDFSHKPAYRALERLIREEWHTREAGDTGSGNRFDLRGFYGQYDVTAACGGRVWNKKIHLSRDIRHTRGEHRIVLEGAGAQP